jgi:hypothetical protein
MMQAWSFAARLPDEIARVLRALGKNRYVQEIDHRIHWAVDVALSDRPEHAEHARRFEARRAADRALEPGSRDPSLWRPAGADDVAAVLSAFWTPGPELAARRERLEAALARAGIDLPEHEPFASDPDEPPFPELVLCDWLYLAVDELDSDQHAGALGALESLGEPVETPSDPVYVEGPTIGPVELLRGAPHGVLPADWLVWADGPYAYVDYVFRGVSRAARLLDPPESPRDLDEVGEAR